MRGGDLERCSHVVGLVAPPLIAAPVVPGLSEVRLLARILHLALHLHLIKIQ